MVEEGVHVEIGQRLLSGQGRDLPRARLHEGRRAQLAFVGKHQHPEVKVAPSNILEKGRKFDCVMCLRILQGHTHTHTLSINLLFMLALCKAGVAVSLFLLLLLLFCKEAAAGALLHDEGVTTPQVRRLPHAVF